MAITANTLVSGYDLNVALGTTYGPAIMQAIQRAIPESTFGMILVDTSTPDISGAFSWRTRCLWLDITNTALPVLKAYRTTGSTGWFAVADAISNSTITTAMLQAGAVTLAKLYAPGASEAAKLLRVDASGAGFELVTVANVIAGFGVIPIGSLDNTIVSLGDEKFIGTLGGAAGQNYWRSADYIATLFTDAVIAPSNIASATVNSSRTKFLSSRTGDTTGVYREINPDTDLIDGLLNGDKLLDGSVIGDKLIDLSVAGTKIENATINVTTKLSPGTNNAGKVIGVNNTGTAIVFRSSFSGVSTLIVLPTPGTSIAPYVHGYITPPSSVRWVIVCVSGDAGYTPNDEVDIFSMFTSSGSGQTPAFTPWTNTLSLFLHATSFGVAFVNENSPTGTFVAVVYNNWRLKAYYAP